MTKFVGSCPFAEVRGLGWAVVSFALASPAIAQEAAPQPTAVDFGAVVQSVLQDSAPLLFGFESPVPASAPATSGPYRTLSQSASDQILLAPGLSVSYLTRSAGDSTDMMAFFPATNPTHLITCVEGGREDLGGGRLNPSVQRISLATGEVTTILRGMEGCDGIRTTAWGTVLATEETDDGGAYEIATPRAIAEHTLVDRATGEVRDSGGARATKIVKRTALPTMAWEGVAVLASGVVIAGDELRPGTANPDADGGSIFKFVPTTPWNGTPLGGDLTRSPLVAGSVLAFQVSCVGGRQQFGQGCEIGEGAWIAVGAETVRADADRLGATGFYRPEDLHQDPLYRAAVATPNAVRFCWTNTGNEGASNFAEVVCGVDPNPLSASSRPIVNRFVEGDRDFNSFDNLDFHPTSGQLYVIEDHPNGDVFACLPDGSDRDIKTDGCLRVFSVRDSTAEPTGFIFDPSGRKAYVSIQHSADDNMPLFDGYATDDVLVISGFRP